MRLIIPFLALSLLGCTSSAARPALPAILVQPERVADGGLQPQLVADPSGRIHLLYFKGKPEAGDLFYTSRAPDTARWVSPVRVNSRAGSAIAAGTIRGGQLAIDAAGRVHVLWNGSGQTKRADGSGMQLLYTRSSADRSRFEDERDLGAGTMHLDGGGTIAAGPNGDLYTVWHAAHSGAAEGGEAARRIFVAVSEDGGDSFSRPRAIFGEGHGACACCGMRAHVDRDGKLRILYRTATGGINRDMFLLTSADRGRTVQSVRLDAWPVST